MWIIAEYSLSLIEVENGLSTIKQSLGELPFYTIYEDAEVTDLRSSTTNKPQTPASMTISSRQPAILANGTYATKRYCF